MLEFKVKDLDCKQLNTPLDFLTNTLSLFKTSSELSKSC